VSVPFKICGLGRAEDVAVAVACGATAVGFVLWSKSPRSVSLATAETLAAGLPPFVAAIPVMVEPTIEEVRAATSALRTRHVQLHGARTPPVAELADVTVIRAASLESAADVPEHWTLLLDAADPVAHGGTGRTIDWTAAAGIASRRPTVLAGGLSPENVAEAIDRVHPAAVDVASGVEIEPGRKSHEAIAAFAAAVRSGAAS